jgi:PAS domain S-box-containing protein
MNEGNNELCVLFRENEALRNQVERLEAESLQLSTILDRLIDGIIIANTTGIVLYINHSAEALTGWAETDAKGRNVNEVFRVVNEEHCPIDHFVGKVIYEGVSVNRAKDALLLANDNKKLPIKVSNFPLRDSQGRTTGKALVFRARTNDGSLLSARRDQEECLSFVEKPSPTGQQEIERDEATVITLAGVPQEPRPLVEAIHNATESKRSEEPRRESERRFTNLFNNAKFGIVLHEAVLNTHGEPIDFIFLDANPAFEIQSGLRVADLVGKSVVQVFPGVKDSTLIRIYRDMALGSPPASFESFFEPLQRYYQFSVFRVDSGRFAVVFDDITLRKVQEREIERLGVLYSTRSQINKTIVRVKTLEELAREITRITIDFGGFKLAWLGKHNPRTGDITPLGYAGEPTSFVHDVQHSSFKGADQQCFCGRAIRENRSCVVNDVPEWQEVDGWPSVMKRVGIRAAAVIPVHVRGTTWGVFGVYADDAGVFREKVTVLLEELALDIGYAVEHIENETHRRQAEKLQLLSNEILYILNEPLTLQEATNAVLGRLKKEIGIDAVGIRLDRGDDFPYLSQTGFDKDFLLAENSIVLRNEMGAVCRDVDGQPCLECTCGLVLSGKTGPPSDYVTSTGSLWTNDANALAQSLRGRDPRLMPRNRCLHEGYESIALIPIRTKDRTLGLLHLNDRKKDRFTPELIHFFEGLTATLGIAVERKRAEEALRVNERLLRDVADNYPNSYVSIIEKDLTIGFASGQQFKKQGLDPAQYIGLHLDQVFGENTPIVRENYLKAFGGTETEFELFTHNQHQSYRAIPLKGNNGKIDRILAVVEDISARKYAEEKLKASQEYLDRIINALGDPVFVKNEELKFVLVNDALCTLLGKTRNELLGKVGLEFLPQDEMAHFLEMDRKVLTSGVEDLTKDFLTAQHGKVRTIVTKKTRYVDNQGTKFVVGTVRDVTEYEQLEEQLRTAQKMEAIGSLAGGIAHDFNNLLSVILSYTGFAMEELADGAPLLLELNEVKQAAIRAATLTRQLLAFSRKQILQPIPLCLNQIAARIEKMLRRIVGEDIDFVQVLAPDLGVVRADPGQIEQVLMNLVVNARDAMPKGGKIIITTTNVELHDDYATQHLGVTPGSYVELTVQDNGSGMDEQTKSRLFEPFFTTKEKGKGTGLGLSTVYGIVKQSGGNIWVYSELGRGTTFKIHLPREAEMTLSDTPPSVRTTPINGTETVLVVEDEDALREVCRRALTTVGYTVLTASNGLEALESARRFENKIQLLLTDIVMPQMSGQSLAQKLVELRPGITVLYMSGYTDNTIAQHGVLDLETHFIGKPFTAPELVRKVRQALDDRARQLSNNVEI